MNSNQYSSLPHTQNAGVGTQQSRNAYANNGNPLNKPYNKKKKNYNKQASSNYNKPNQPFNNYINNINNTGKEIKNKILFKVNYMPLNF